MNNLWLCLRVLRVRTHNNDVVCRWIHPLGFGRKSPPKPWREPERLPELSREMSLVGEASSDGDFSERRTGIAQHLARPLQTTNEKKRVRARAVCVAKMSRKVKGAEPRCDFEVREIF